MSESVNEIILCEAGWWIVSRRRSWGPFDYQWSDDLRGVEFTFQGSKFGEVCGPDEFFADLAPYRLPISVCRTAAVVAGSVAISVSMAEGPEARAARLARALDKWGFGRFAVRTGGQIPAPDKRHSRDT